VRRRPYSVVLLDEVEKAHPETFDILLQVLDDGRLTDGQGRTVDFRNVILVMTSNIGSAFLVDPTMTDDAKREAVMGMVRASFKPEFLNRLDEVVIFDPLTTEELARIVDLQVRALSARLGRPADHPGGHRGRQGVAGAHRLRPGIRCSAVAPVGAARDRRPAGSGAARG
jgi:ATP-dependent Clp protease ATP-binding subunit ClpB